MGWVEGPWNTRWKGSPAQPSPPACLAACINTATVVQHRQEYANNAVMTRGAAHAGQHMRAAGWGARPRLD